MGQGGLDNFNKAALATPSGFRVLREDGPSRALAGEVPLLHAGPVEHDAERADDAVQPDDDEVGGEDRGQPSLRRRADRRQ